MGLKDQRNDFEDLCLTQLKAILPEGVTIQADRGFGDVKLFEFLESLARISHASSASGSQNQLNLFCDQRVRLIRREVPDADTV